METYNIKNILPIISIKDSDKYLNMVKEALTSPKLNKINFDEKISIKLNDENIEFRNFVNTFTPKHWEENSIITYFSNPFIKDEEKINLIKILNTKNILTKYKETSTLLSIIKVNKTNFQIYLNKKENYKKLELKYGEKLFKEEINDETISNEQLKSLSFYINKGIYKNKEKEVYKKLIKVIFSIIKFSPKDTIRTKFNLDGSLFLKKILKNDFILTLDETQKEELERKIIEVSFFSPLKEKKSIVSSLYTHIKIKKMKNLPQTVEPSVLINSINISNPLYVKRIVNRFKNKEIKLLNAMEYLNNYFNSNLKSHNFIMNNLQYFKTSNYEIFESLEKNSFLVKDYPKEIDFLFKKKEFHIKEFHNEINKLMESYKSNKNNKILLKISIMLTLAFENVNFMNEIFEKLIKSENEIEKSFYKKIHNEITHGIKYFQSIKEEVSNMSGNLHTLRFNFNINDFLKMEEEFQKKYINDIITMMQNSTNERTNGYQKLFRIIEKSEIARNIFKDSLYISNNKNILNKDAIRYDQLNSLSIYANIVDKLENAELLKIEEIENKKLKQQLEEMNNIVENIELY